MDRLKVLAKHFYVSALQEAGNDIQRSNSDSVEREPLVRNRAEYERLYQRSIEDPNGFWTDMGSQYFWRKKWDTQHHSFNFDISKGPVHLEWFKGGQTNITYNCLDRWIASGNGNRLCFMWEGNDYGHERAMTYQQVLDEVCRVASWLRAQGVRKGDTVAIYLPMICELPTAMLACARIGAVHSVVFAGFSAESLAQRIVDGKSRVVITASGVLRGTKLVELKRITDQACAMAASEGHSVQRVLVCEKSALQRESTPWVPHRDQWWREEIPRRADYCPPEWLDAEEPLFILYTSGSTGKPKGVLHSTGGYMVGAGTSCKYVFDLRPGDVYWCTADCGWITGHTYLAYGPLLCGASQVLFGSTPTYPDPGRCWRIIEKYQVRQFYTAPTLIRSLMQAGDEWVTKHNRSSLRLLGTVGEPINPHAWSWYHDVVGEARCPIVDTWWQTETGMVLLTPLPGAWETPAGTATLPFFGVQPVLLDEKGRELQGPAVGILAIKAPWPAMMRSIYGDHERFQQTYFSAFKGYYFTGDGARRDERGFLTITGRVDDVINVSGHRVGSAEVEGALTQHPLCNEAAVIGIVHDVKGQAIYAFVTVAEGAPHSEKLRRELADAVRKTIGSFAVPDTIHWAPGLPKTRSGKIMRRVLRKIAACQDGELGDVSTLAEPQVVQQLIATRGT